MNNSFSGMVLRLLILMAFISLSLYSQTFNQLLSQINSSPEANRSAIIDAYLTGHPVSPVIELDTMVYFIYRGNATGINISGDMNGWVTNALPMTKVSTTDLWYCGATFETDARLDYKFVLNGSTWILDPRNPYQCSGGFGPNSELRMPAYIPAPEIEFNTNIPHGRLQDTLLFSAGLNNSRKITIYTPADYDTSSGSYPVMIFHDGLEYISLAKTNNVLDYLIAKNKIEPIIAVFVPPVSRSSEYAGGQISKFSAFIVNDVVQYVDSKYRTKRDASNRATLGASDGGNISLYLGLNYPDIIGNVAAQSSNIINSISTGFQASQKLNLKLYLDLGTYDIASLIPLVKNFIPVIRSKGYPYIFIEYHEGHSWGNWRAHIDDALIFFFGRNASGTKSEGAIPRQIQLEQNYPNPFSGLTNVDLRLPAAKAENITFKIYDVTGREVLDLSDKIIDNSILTIDNSQLPMAGLYFYQLTVDNNTQTKMMVHVR